MSEGCKIKALRNKTNTYIKTPVRGEEPIFVVTGRREDVDAARREIISAADHFSHIRATRTGGGSARHSGDNGGHEPSERHQDSAGQHPSSTSPRGRPRTPSPSVGEGAVSGRHRGQGHHAVAATVAGQVTIGVRVPISMVGLVVGPKGATVKRIQQDTGTYIVTPGRQKDPVFEVIGTAVGVEKARRQIEAYLETRIGPSSSPTSSTSSSLSLAAAAAAGGQGSTSPKACTDRPGNNVGGPVTAATDSLDWCRSCDDEDRSTCDGSSSYFQHEFVADISAKHGAQPQLSASQYPHQFADSRPTLYTDWSDAPSSFRQEPVGSASLTAELREFSMVGSQSEQLDAGGLLSWFYSKMLLNNNIINNADSFVSSAVGSVEESVAERMQQYRHHHHQQQYAPHHRNNLTSEGLWSTVSAADTPRTSSLIQQFEEDLVCGDFEVSTGVRGELDSHPLSDGSWNYIFAAAGLRPEDVDSRYGRPLHCSGDTVDRDMKYPTSSSFWSPLKTDFARVVGTGSSSAHYISSANRIMFDGVGSATNGTATPNIRIGGASNGRCNSFCRGFVNGGGDSQLDGGNLGQGLGGSEETSPSSMSPVESFSVGSSSG